MSNTVQQSVAEEAALMLDIPDTCYKKVKRGQGEGFLLTEEEINVFREEEMTMVEAPATDRLEIAAREVELDLNTYGEYLKGLKCLSKSRLNVLKEPGDAKF